MSDPSSAQGRRAPSVDPVVEAYKRDVDLSLIREQRMRSIDARVARMIAALRLAEELEVRRGDCRSASMSPRSNGD